MKRVYIALGSNIEPMLEYLDRAISAIDKCEKITVIEQSSVYQTVPKGYTDQDDFYNMVITVRTELTPRELLNELHIIEQTLHRKRTIKNGPRTIDLDIITFNQLIMNEDDLIIPHPRMNERAFVLVPFAEIDADFRVAGLDQSVKVLKQELSSEELDEVKNLGKLSELLSS